jgi:hypothetical protein
MNFIQDLPRPANEPKRMLFADLSMNHPQVGLLREDPKRDHADCASFDSVGSPQPDRRGTRQAVGVNGEDLWRAIVPEEVAEVEGGDAFDRDYQFVTSYLTSCPRPPPLGSPQAPSPEADHPLETKAGQGRPKEGP